MTPGLHLSHPLWLAPAALLLVLAFTPLVIRLARWQGWIAQPKADRWHRKPTALMGGIAIYAGVALSWLLLVPDVASWWIVLAGGTLMFLTGLVDDLRNLSPVTKLLAQIVAASLTFYAGYEVSVGGAVWLSFPLTLFWIIGITNAVNLLDNMDGLAAGVSGIAALALAGFVAASGDPVAASLGLAVAGAAAGFLVFNFAPARIFMGDSGSLFLGFTIATLALSLPASGGTSGLLVMLLIPVAVMAVPIFDTTLVTLKRVISGRAVSQGGRDHSSHRLVSLGLSERRAVLTLYGVSGLFGGLALIFQFVDVYLYYALLIFAAVGLAIFGVFLGEVRVYEPDVENRGRLRSQGRSEQDGVFLRAMLQNKRQILRILVDLPLVVAALVVAYHLRFESGFTVVFQQQMMDTLPLIVTLKMSTLYAAGVYRGSWRYAGSHEVVQVVKASVVGSALAMLVLLLLYRFENYSRSLFVIDWLLTTVALIGVRGAFRGLRGYFSGRRTSGKRVLLYGAGDAGFLALREIAQNPELGLVPVGFIDDDPTKQRHRMRGLPVVGRGDDLAQLCKRHGADEIILTMFRVSPEEKVRIYQHCEDQRVQCRELRVSFAALRPPEPTTEVAMPLEALSR